MTDSARLLPSLAFGQPGPVRDFLVGEILSGRKTGSSNLRVLYELWGQSIPSAGDRYALLDSQDERVAVIRFDRVSTITFPEATPEVAVRESATLEQWHSIHRDFWAGFADDIRAHLDDPDWAFGDAEPIVTTAFTLEARPATGLGVIGAGFHATRNILPSVVLAGVPITALATRDTARSRAALLRFGSEGTAYADADALLADPSVRDVTVIAQPEDQAALTLRAIAAGKNVFADKPLGLNPAQAQEIADAAAEADVIVMVGFMKRHAPAYVRLRELLEEGALGTPRSFELSFGCDSTPFCATEEEFVTLAAIHVVDLVRSLFGEVESAVTHSNSAGAHIALSTTLRFASGVVGTLNLTGLPSYSSEFEMLRVSGDAGHAVVTDVARLQLHVVAEGDAPSWQALSESTTVFAPAESAMSGVERDLFLRGFVGEIRAFRQAAAAHEQPSSSAADNVRTMKLCELILQADDARAVR